MTQDLFEGPETGERVGLHNPQPRARTLVALFAAIIMIAPATAFAAAPLVYLEQEADTFIDRIDAKYGDHIDSVAMLADYDRDMIVSVIAIESEGNPRATSPVGARGLMQLMPSTAKYLGVKDSTDPFQNILGGTKYLKKLEDQYGFEDTQEALIAYNMGPARARRFLSQYEAKDHAYVKRVMLVYNKIQDRKRIEAQASALRNSIESNTVTDAVHPTPVVALVGRLVSPLLVAEASTVTN